MNGFDRELNAFVQSYGAKELDASLLMIPIVGFLPPSDPLMIGTVAAIEKQLMHNGFVMRYATGSRSMACPPVKAHFCAVRSGWWTTTCCRDAPPKRGLLFGRLVGLCNDVGLLSEEYDPLAERMLGNFPQALSHISLVNSALRLAGRADALNTSRSVQATA